MIGLVDTVREAIDIQTAMMARQSDSPENLKIRFRCGITVGDVVFDDGDVFGASVNVATRLESMTEPGGVCLSDVSCQMVQDSISAPFNDLGAQKVKTISRAVRVWQWTPDTPEREIETSDAARAQQIQFCITRDHVQLAYARVGQGPPLMKVPNWLNHLDDEWRSAIWGPLLLGLKQDTELVRFDNCGGGLSDWDVEGISLGAFFREVPLFLERLGP